MGATRHEQAAATVAPPAGAPVFVDNTGRRRRRIRRAAFTLAIGACGYGVVVVISLLGGPVPPNVLLPLPGSANGPASARAAASATPHATTPAGGGSQATGPGSGTATGTSRPGAPVASPTPATAPVSSAAASPSVAASHIPPGLASKSATPGATGHRH